MRRRTLSRGVTRTRSFTYRRGRTGRKVHVRAHPTHYVRGPPPEFMVLYRAKEYPRGTRHRWHHDGPYHTEASAERRRRSLMDQGFHAIVERSGGGRSTPGPGTRELESLAAAADRRRGRAATRGRRAPHRRTRRS